MMSTLTSLNGVVLKPVAGQNIITSQSATVVPLTISILPAQTSDAFVIQEPAGTSIVRILDTQVGVHNTPTLLLNGSAGGWGIGIDQAAADVPYGDFFIEREDFPSAGLSRDVFYISQRSTNPPGIGIGVSAARIVTDQASYMLSVGPWSDDPSTKGGLLVRSGATQDDTAPVLDLIYQFSAGAPLLRVLPTGAIQSTDKTSTAIWSSQAGQIWAAQRLAVGGGTTVTQSAAVVQIKTASGTDATINVTTGAGNGNLTIQATDAAATCMIRTVNASDLLLGTNTTTYWTLKGSSAAVKGLIIHAPSLTLSAGPADLTLHQIAPVIAGAFTVTRLDYIELSQPTGVATITDAAVFQFDAAAGTHKATVGATTKVTVTAVTAWLKVNMNGTILYSPLYTSTTA